MFGDYFLSLWVIDAPIFWHVQYEFQRFDHSCPIRCKMLIVRLEGEGQNYLSDACHSPVKKSITVAMHADE